MKDSLFMKHLGNKIREKRKEKGVSQEELASVLGITKASISKYELGIREPSFRQMIKIANAMSIDPLSLVKEILSTPAVDALPMDYAWIPVSERMPEYKTEVYEGGSYEFSPWVLGCDEKGKIQRVMHEKSIGFCGWIDEPGTEYKITHWMPLPAVPKEVQK